MDGEDKVTEFSHNKCVRVSGFSGRHGEACHYVGVNLRPYTEYLLLSIDKYLDGV